MIADRVRLVVRRVDHPDAMALLSSFHREQLGRYDAADPIDLPPDEYIEPGGVFAVLYDGDLPVACGGYRWHDRRTATVELKRVYVSPAARGRGLGRRILAWLEEQAASRGAAQLILETGVRNTAAIDLFTRSGFVPTERYVPGRDPAINRAFSKRLAG